MLKKQQPAVIIIIILSFQPVFWFTSELSSVLVKKGWVCVLTVDRLFYVWKINSRSDQETKKLLPDNNETTVWGKKGKEEVFFWQ